MKTEARLRHEAGYAARGAWRGRMTDVSARAPDLNVEYSVYCMEPVRLTVVLLIFLTLNLKAAVA